MLSYLPRPKRPLLPDKFYEPLPGGFTHVLLINSHNLVTSQELVLRGASCRGEERGMRAWSHCWESAGLGGSRQCLKELKRVLKHVGNRALQWLVVGVLFMPLLPVPDTGQKTEEQV